MKLADMFFVETESGIFFLLVRAFFQLVNVRVDSFGIFMTK